MPRDQETSFRHDQVADDDPLFREPTGNTPATDDLAATGRADATGEATDAPGEWVAGSRNPGYPGDDDTLPPSTAADSDRTDVVSAPATTDADTASDLRTTRDPEVAPDTALTADQPVTDGPFTDGSVTDQPVTDQPVTPAEGAPDGVLNGAEKTPPNGLPVATAPAAEGATASTAGAASTGAVAADAATDAASPTPAATPDTPVPGAPGTANTAGVDAAAASFVTNGDELHGDWARIQSSFVDDPHESVSQAAALVEQVTNSLVTALHDREQTLRSSLDAQGSDTEHLRNALRDYRAFFERLVKL
jgi:hypothetical protein